MTTTNVVKFPTGRIVRERYYRVKDSPERIEIDAALDSIMNAMAALKNQQRSVLTQLHHLVNRQVVERGRAPWRHGPDGGAA
jgi:hypothetical protein